MTWTIFIARRVLLALVQIVVIVVVTFVVLRLLPANPAYRIAGFNTTPQHIHQIEVQLGLNKPIPVQLWEYAKQVFHGNLGTSTSTGDSVVSDLKQRVPATAELIIIGLTIAVLFALPLGVWSARRSTGIAHKAFRGYSLLAGSQPEYWWGLILVFVFFVTLKWVPGPAGRVGIGITPPARITGFYTIDSILHGDWATLGSVLKQLILPVATIVIVYMAPILKMTRGSYAVSAQSESIRFMRASGLSEGAVSRAALRLASPSIITIVGITFAFLLGGAALVETVFSWNGVAQYAVQAAVTSDYPAMQGAVLAIATLSAVVYLITDLTLAMLDRRVVRL